MPTIFIKDPDVYGELALRRFKRACEKAGILPELRRRERHIKPTELRKNRFTAAIKRHWKRLTRENPFLLRNHNRSRRRTRV